MHGEVIKSIVPLTIFQIETETRVCQENVTWATDYDNIVSMLYDKKKWVMATSKFGLILDIVTSSMTPWVRDT